METVPYTNWRRAFKWSNKENVQRRCSFFTKYREVNSLRKICLNKGFLWTVYYCIRKESQILSLYSNIRFRENPYFSIYYAVINIISSTENRHNPTQNGNSISNGIWKKIIPTRDGTKYCVRMLKVTYKNMT